MTQDNARRQAQERLARLRDQASRCSPAERRSLSALLDQDPDASDLRCPRYLAITMNAGQRRLVVGEEQDALGEVLSEMAVAEGPWIPQTLIDLQTAERSQARIAVRFTASTRLLPAVAGDVLELESRRAETDRDHDSEQELEQLLTAP